MLRLSASLRQGPALPCSHPARVVTFGARPCAGEKGNALVYHGGTGNPCREGPPWHRSDSRLEGIR
jgi:hypothetical protein